VQEQILVDGAGALVFVCADGLVVVVESKDRRRGDLLVQWCSRICGAAVKVRELMSSE
jgi:predicted regulator of Ras-like GTPase activity (Roadblock/LC7/MglB family)